MVRAGQGGSGRRKGCTRRAQTTVGSWRFLDVYNGFAETRFVALGDGEHIYEDRRWVGDGALVDMEVCGIWAWCRDDGVAGGEIEVRRSGGRHRRLSWDKVGHREKDGGWIREMALSLEPGGKRGSIHSRTRARYAGRWGSIHDRVQIVYN